ncbi:methionyl-tRNA formyltransferase [Clostridium acetobutylicum]|uniref:Methionyl-tRNA formyltransferase n=1 Tax=Clostridium acetobutylicum (strain ATCC 824 / DSM 792 / JCM 1419 / IAM 19013 / LMG 5710 / NBRC 13948 / NRRL B-527 / VKM B-1787 / 2291 / W) TaxID=272562 RepID=FMT_CLOAB|nr:MULTISPECIES: methionyl-tRNA formyltransferase [Clostridium]O05101.2 RecName: Full=Methionyl-tRNA formyltransferase [Clostridium acetobutylicum ATCC 824]AAK79689.1 Methionyl-tRNA formyltransferase [Clostridium acetobutylicum ATCC 824]ADZ20773.1 methionyl-tRNA formyltransferase [Clostridium acetobutylicum EA 2018]AEI33348.1 methionyl-tRNA formyltransferase [Clostridium acetobutylicum DSM 1731]AWV79876.1 methionyl-tRNA formyltransferase [Clostridium acetobutylicum]MBC2394140.1 methionyl-tRNA
MLKIVFMGTPEFSVPSLEKLIENYDVRAVLTQPDKPKGRGKKLAMSEVKEVAVKNNIPVFQPVKLKNDIEVINKLKEIAPDFIVVVAFGQILSKEVLDIPKYACINLHASLLPNYRGAAPINWAIINGETKTGNTTMIMAEGLDTGDMLLKDEVDIKRDMTAGELHDILMNRGADLLVKTIDEFSKGNIKPEKQGEPETDYAAMLSKDTGKINWNDKSERIYNLIRGLNPWPLAYSSYNDKVMKIHEAKILDAAPEGEPGLITNVDNNGIEVNSSDGKILITKIQFPGKKSMNVGEYIRGNNIDKGVILK